MSDERDRQDFAERAAAKFKEDPEISTFTDDDIAPGELLALRWGMHDRAVLVLRIGDDAPVVYADLVPGGA